METGLWLHPLLLLSTWSHCVPSATSCLLSCNRGEVWDSPCSIFVQITKFVNIRRISIQVPSTLASFGRTWGKFHDYCQRNFYSWWQERKSSMSYRWFFLLTSIYNVSIQSWWWILFPVWHTVYPLSFMLLPTTRPFLFQNRAWKYIFLMRGRRHGHLTVCFYTFTDAAAWEASYRCWSSSRESVSAGIIGIHISTSCVVL